MRISPSIGNRMDDVNGRIFGAVHPDGGKVSVSSASLLANDNNDETNSIRQMDQQNNSSSFHIPDSLRFLSCIFPSPLILSSVERVLSFPSFPLLFFSLLFSVFTIHWDGSRRSRNHKKRRKTEEEEEERKTPSHLKSFTVFYELLSSPIQIK